MRLQRLQSRRRPAREIPSRRMGAARHPRQHDQPGVHGHAAERRSHVSPPPPFFFLLPTLLIVIMARRKERERELFHLQVFLIELN